MQWVAKERFCSISLCHLPFATHQTLSPYIPVMLLSQRPNPLQASLYTFSPAAPAPSVCPNYMCDESKSDLLPPPSARWWWRYNSYRCSPQFMRASPLYLKTPPRICAASLCCWQFIFPVCGTFLLLFFPTLRTIQRYILIQCGWLILVSWIYLY